MNCMRSIVCVAIAVAQVLALGGPAVAQGPYLVRVGGITGEPTNIVGIWSAVKEDFFKGEGLNPVFSFHPSGPVVLQAMAAGDVDVSSSTAISVMFQAISSGVDLVFVASTLKNNSPLLARPEIKTVRDLNGKRVGTPGIGTIQDTLLGVFEKQHGITTQHVYGRMPDLVTYLEKGELEAIAGWFPATEIARRKVGGHYLARVVVPGAESVGVIVPRALLQKQPDVIRRFLRADLRGLQYFRKNREAFADWAAKREHVDIDVVRTVLLDGEMVLADRPVPDYASTKILIRAARDAGKIPKEKIPDDAAIDAWMSKHIDESFLRAAMKDVGWDGR